ncbi:MAG: ABC transporter permease [Gemmatimonadota bacterium]|nr:MAG: ABC transporter permease [Gemmatimonadota bacterium]
MGLELHIAFRYLSVKRWWHWLIVVAFVALSPLWIIAAFIVLAVASERLADISSRAASLIITIIAIGGIYLGVAALIVVIGVMSGLQTEVRDRILGTNPHIMMLTYGDELRFEDWEGPLEAARADPDVTIGEPFVYTQSLVFKRVHYQQGLALRGISQDATERLGDQTLVGDWNFNDTGSGLPGLVLGFRLAGRLQAGPGDTVNLISGQGAELTPAGFIPKFKKFEVVGLFRSGMFEYDNQMAYSSLEAAQDLVGLDDAVTGLAFWVKDPWKADEVAARLSQTLGYPYYLRDWKVTNEGLFNALKLEKMGMALVLALIVIVAAFNIVSTLIMVVADKTREIGILRSMGMTSRRVLNVFMLQGLIIGVAGTMLGLVGGLALSWAIDYFNLIALPGDVYLISEIPIILNPLDIAWIVAAGIFISLLATVYPSHLAARLTPVEAIRHE